MHTRSRAEDEDLNQFKRIVKRGVVIFIATFAIITLFMGVFTVGQYERDVITRYGAFLRIADPGLNFKLPWVDGSVTFDLREKRIRIENIEAYTYDQQLAKIDYEAVIAPTIDKVKIEEIFTKYGDLDYAVTATIPQSINKEIKIVMGQYTASKAIQERGKFNTDVMERIEDVINNSGYFTLKLSSITDVEYSQAYVSAVEQRMTAEVEVLKEKQKLEKEKVQADTVRIQADAAAYQREAAGKAEAVAIDAVNQALERSPKYVDKIIAERWDGKLPHTMVPGTAVPFINVK